MIIPIHPPPPDPVNYQYPSGLGIAYIPILDGVAARLRYTNKGSGDRGFTCSLPTGKLVTRNMAAAQAPLEVIPFSPGSGDTWAQARTSVIEDNSDGVRKVLFTYDGVALPAMPSNVNPSGWYLSIHPWHVHDGAFDNGFEVTYTRGLDPNVPTAFSVAFVPYFKIVASSTTPSITDGTDQTWYLYFAKPLNSNQTTALQVSVSTMMFGTLQNLAFTVETNAYGQATALKVTVPMATKHVNASGVYNITVAVTQSLYYLKGDNFVTENITLVSENYNVNVTLVADTTAPEIINAQVLPKAQALSQDGVLQVSLPGTIYGDLDCIACRQTITAQVQDSGAGLDRVELWAQWLTGSPVFIADQQFGGQKTPGLFSADIMTLAWDYMGSPGFVQFLVKAYDMSGNTSSRYANSYGIGGNRLMLRNAYLHVIGATPSGNYNATTGQWSAITGVHVQVDAPKAFIGKVEAYVDNVLTTTVLGSTGIQNGTDPLVHTYEITLPALTAGTHAIKVIAYAAVAPTFSPQTSTMETTVVVGNTGGTGGGGGGCVDLNAAIALANGATKPAWEVQVGDEVLTRNPFTGELAILPIRAVMPMGTQPCFKIVGSDGVEGICSASHRIFEVTSGAYWTAEDLRVGQVLLRADNRVADIVEITPVSDREVITFAIDDPISRNYFADSTLAHNLKAQDCVVPGTLVTMADGSHKPIETLVPGDQILAWDTTTKSFVADTFLSHYITRRSKLFRVTLEDGHVITCTATHVLFTGSVWVSIDQIQKFSSKIKVMVEDGTYSAVDSVEEINGPEVEVRLGEIKNSHTMICGGIVCHNIVKHPTEEQAPIN